MSNTNEGHLTAPSLEKQSFTPAPWAVEYDRWIYSHARIPRDLIADVGFCGHATAGTPEARQVAKANANLIAAAPGLLAALKIIAADLEAEMEVFNGFPGHLIQMHKIACEAIAKAES